MASNQIIVLAEPTSTAQTTESTTVTSAGNNSTGNDSGISVNETTALETLETQDPGEPTTENNDYTDETIQDDSTRGILWYLKLQLCKIISCNNY